MRKMVLLHSKAMMVTTELGDFEVKRLLVENDISDDNLFLSTFLKIGLEFDGLMPCTRIITKFAGNEVTVMQMIFLPSTLGVRPKAVTKII